MSQSKLCPQCNKEISDDLFNIEFTKCDECLAKEYKEYVRSQKNNNLDLSIEDEEKKPSISIGEAEADIKKIEKKLKSLETIEDQKNSEHMKYDATQKGMIRKLIILNVILTIAIVWYIYYA